MTEQKEGKVENNTIQKPLNTENVVLLNSTKISLPIVFTLHYFRLFKAQVRSLNQAYPQYMGFVFYFTTLNQKLQLCKRKNQFLFDKLLVVSLMIRNVKIISNVYLVLNPLLHKCKYILHHNYKLTKQYYEHDSNSLNNKILFL